MKIKKIEIYGLWGKYDYVWELNEDVNVLSGINGSGKTTILNEVASVLKTGKLPKEGFYNHIFDFSHSVFIYFDNDCRLESFYFQRGKEYLEENAEKPGVFRRVYTDTLNDFEGLERRQGHEINSFRVSREYAYKSEAQISISELLKDINFNFIKTFEQPFRKDGNELNIADKISDGQALTDLDLELIKLQEDYLNYQAKIGSLFSDPAQNNQENVQSEAGQMIIRKRKLNEMINNLFDETGKQIHPGSSKLLFLNKEKEELSQYILSSGEKQMLIILLTVFLQEHKESILILDEPEVSLHFDWQEKLIENIRELHPNCQIIIATHSPGIVVNGWQNKTVNLEDLRVTEEVE